MNDSPLSHSIDEESHSIEIPKSEIEENASPLFATRKDSRTQRAIWVTSWFLLNTGLALLMKFVFDSSAFKFPVLMSTVHMVICTILSFLTMHSGMVPNEKLGASGNKRLRYFVFLFCLNIAFGNVAVKIVNLPLSQMVRS